MATPFRAVFRSRSLTLDWITRATDHASANLAREGVDLRRLRKRGFEAAALNTEIIARHNRRYSLTVPFGPVADQEQSGRCWLFAPVILAQAAALRERRLTGKDTFAATYLYFFDLLEQASTTLADVHRLSTRKESLARDTLRRRLSGEVIGVGDGGEWEWAFNLIHKYGLVPASAMPETASSKATKSLGVDLHERFARAARLIRKDPDNYPVIRNRALADVVRMLVAHLGHPPTAVRWRGRTISPAEYANTVVGFRPVEWRVVINNPLLPFDRVYERRGSAITHNARRFNLRRLNVSQSRLRDLVRGSLQAGYAAGFSADVDRNDVDHDRGIMHPAIFNRSRVYGSQLVRDLPRREDIYLGIAASKHAMAITGLDDGGRGAAVKYRVVNSWGRDVGDRGLYHMYAEWFEENVFKLAVHESVLTARERAAYDEPVAAPGGKFY
jgi:bleomycin hydrolase